MTFWIFIKLDFSLLKRSKNIENNYRNSFNNQFFKSI